MDSLRIATEYFADRGMSLTDKSCWSLAGAIGLAGSVEACDEAFVSLTLRHSNSILASLTDRFSLDFAKTDEEVEQHSEAADADIIRDELRQKGYKDSSSWSGYDTDEYGDIANKWTYDERSVPLQYIGAEGEPDSNTLDAFLSSATPEIFSCAIAAAKAERRSKIETFDFMTPFLDLPLTASIFRKARLSEAQLRDELARFKTLEPFAEQQQFILMIDQGRIRLKTFGVLDGTQYEERKASPQNLIIQLAGSSPFISQHSIDEFEELINWPKVSERDIHRFLSQHPNFLLGDDYCTLHTELVLDRADKGPLIPDFFAELTSRNYVDIIDLKKPNEQLIVGSKNRRGFSAAVNSSLYQLRQYRDYFEDSRRRMEFNSRYGLKAWKPKIAVIIGRDTQGCEYEDLIGARRSVIDASIVTYDDILDRARRRSITVGRA